VAPVVFVAVIVALSGVVASVTLWRFRSSLTVPVDYVGRHRK